MEKKFYAVIFNEKPNGDHNAGRFGELEKADHAARKGKGKIFEFKDRPLGKDENHNIRGTLIKDYSK